MNNDDVIVIRRYAMRGYSQMSNAKGLINKPNGKPLLFSSHDDAIRWCIANGFPFVHGEAGEPRQSALRNTIYR